VLGRWRCAKPGRRCHDSSTTLTDDLSALTTRRDGALLVRDPGSRHAPLVVHGRRPSAASGFSRKPASVLGAGSSSVRGPVHFAVGLGAPSEADAGGASTGQR
jgi:hypothetical protein